MYVYIKFINESFKKKSAMLTKQQKECIQVGICSSLQLEKFGVRIKNTAEKKKTIIKFTITAINN